MLRSQESPQERLTSRLMGPLREMRASVAGAIPPGEKVPGWSGLHYKYVLVTTCQDLTMNRVAGGGSNSGLVVADALEQILRGEDDGDD